jgi:hypothetical protein
LALLSLTKDMICINGSNYTIMDDLTATFSRSQYASKKLTHGRDLLSSWTVFKVCELVTNISLRGNMALRFAMNYPYVCLLFQVFCLFSF